VTKADDGVAQPFHGASQMDTSGRSTSSVSVAELTHEVVRAQLSDYLDDSLDQSDRRRIDGHLASCPPCTTYLNTLRATVRGLGKLPAPKAPAGARNRIIEQARREADSLGSDD
jgi:hypothetical protein